MRRDTVIFQQTLFKPGYVPRGVIAAVGIPQPRRAHDGFHGLDRLAAPGDLHLRAPGVVQQLPRFIGQQLLVCLVHQLQLLQALGPVLVLCAQPYGGGSADLIRVKARIHAPVQQLDRSLHSQQRGTCRSDRNVRVDLVQNGERQRLRRIGRRAGAVGLRRGVRFRRDAAVWLCRCGAARRTDGKQQYDREQPCCRDFLKVFHCIDPPNHFCFSFVHFSLRYRNKPNAPL